MNTTELKSWVGVTVRGWYPAPAVSCCANGRRVNYEGKITGIGKHAYLGTCLKLELSDSEADLLYVRPSEFTHRRTASKRWQRINPERDA